MASVFPAPDHDHARCTADAMAHAEALCAERGERLTPMRRRVVEGLSASQKPLGAYEIMDQVARSGPRPAPITVYRALDFLRENGLVHRIESRNAFVACGRNHGSDPLVAVRHLRALPQGVNHDGIAGFCLGRRMTKLTMDCRSGTALRCLGERHD